MRMANNAPTSDIGRPDLGWHTAWGYGMNTDWWESTADLIWPQSMITYGRMRHDLQVKAVLSAYRLPILRATWALDPDGCRDEVVKACADDLGLPIMGSDAPPGPARRRGVIWHRHLAQALQELVYGHMIFERRYEYLPDGRASLAHLGQRPPWTVAAMNVGPDGVVRAITQTTQSDPIPAERLVWYVVEQEGSNWSGVSPLRAAFGAWLLKHEGWRVHATSIRRFGMGIPTVEAPVGGNATQVAQAAQLASSMRAGDQAGIGLPNGFKAGLMGMSGGTPDGVAWIQYLDRAIAKGALAGLIELGQTETGSRALGETFMDLFQLSLQSVADDLATAATSGHEGMPGIVTGIVDQNWGPDEPAPRIVCTDVGENYELSADALQSLTMSGVISPDPTLDMHARKLWRLPKRSTPWVPSSRGIPAGTSIRPNVEQQYAEQAVQTEGVKDEPPATKTAPQKAPPASTQGNPLPVKAAAAAPRRESQAGFNAAAHQQAWQHAVDSALAAYRPVVNAQRMSLVEQVAAAANPAYLDQPPLGDGPQVIFDAMLWAARQAAQAVVAEAAQQGVSIDPAAIRVDERKLRGVAVARAQAAAAAITQAASAKALQVMAAAPPPDQQPQQRPSSEAAAGSVAIYLDGFTDANLREQLGAALTSAQNHGRVAAFAAAPVHAVATYIATEINDQNTCQPCRGIDGTEFPDLRAAEAAYPMGGYEGCLGLARCRGTTMAVWHEVRAAAFDEGKHPRVPKGAPHGGEFFKIGDLVRFKGETLPVQGFTMHPERRHLPAGVPHVRIEPASRAGNAKRKGKWVPVNEVQKLNAPKPVPKPGDQVRLNGEVLKVHDVTMHPERRHLPAGEPHVRVEPASRAGNAKRKGKWVPVGDVTIVPGAGTRKREGPKAPAVVKQPVPAPRQFGVGQRVRVGGQPGNVVEVKRVGLRQLVRVDLGDGPRWFAQPAVQPADSAKQLDKVLQEAIKPKLKANPDFKRGDIVIHNGKPFGVINPDVGSGQVHIGNGHGAGKFVPAGDLRKPKTGEPGGRVPAALKPGGFLGPKSKPPSAPQDKGKFRPGDKVQWHGRDVTVKQIHNNGDVIVKTKGGNWERAKPHEVQFRPKTAPKAPPKVWKRGDQALVHGEPVVVRHVGPGDVLKRNRPFGGDSMIRVRHANDNRNMWVRHADLKEVPPPAPPKPFHVDPKLDNPAQANLRKSYNSGVARKTKLSGGCQGITNLAVLNDGSKVVEKKLKNWHGTPGSELAAAEHLSYEVGNAVGGIDGLMPTILVSKDTVVMKFAAGAKVGYAWKDGASHAQQEELFNSPEGLRIGVMDILNKNTDRHGFNWMVQRDARGVWQPIPIDNSSTYGIQGGGAPGVFRQALEAQIAAGKHPFTRTEILAMDTQLNELKSKFDAAGKGQWQQEMLARWKVLRFQLEAPKR